jgi:hypothetical protein
VIRSPCESVIHKVDGRSKYEAEEKLIGVDVLQRPQTCGRTAVLVDDVTNNVRGCHEEAAGVNEECGSNACQP